MRVFFVLLLKKSDPYLVNCSHDFYGRESSTVFPNEFTFYPFTLIAFLDLPEGFLPFIACCVCGLFCCFYSSLPRTPLLSTVFTAFSVGYMLCFCIVAFIQHVIWTEFPELLLSGYYLIISNMVTVCLLPDFAAKKTIKNAIFLSESKPFLCAQGL